MLRNPPHQNRLHTQLVAHLLWIDLFAFVTKDGVVRDHLQTRSPRQTVDEIFSQSVREIFQFLIAFGMRERHHGDRFNRLRRSG